MEMFKYLKNMVYGLAKAYGASNEKDNFRPERKTHKKRSGVTEFVAEVAEVVKKNPIKRMRKIAKEMGTSR